MVVSFTLPETNSLPLKIGHSKRKLVFQTSFFRCRDHTWRIINNHGDDGLSMAYKWGGDPNYWIDTWETLPPSNKINSSHLWNDRNPYSESTLPETNIEPKKWMVGKRSFPLFRGHVNSRGCTSTEIWSIEEDSPTKPLDIFLLTHDKNRCWLPPKKHPTGYTHFGYLHWISGLEANCKLIIIHPSQQTFSTDFLLRSNTFPLLKCR